MPRAIETSRRTAPVDAPQSFGNVIPVYVGVDPGKSGGIAALFSSEDLRLWKMPKSFFEILPVLQEITNAANGRPVVCTMEKVNGYIGGRFNPGAAMFVFGQNFGHLEAFLFVAGIQVVQVQPSVWIKYFSMKKETVTRLVKKRKTGEVQKITGKEAQPHWKRRLLNKAQTLYPKTKIHLDVADAVLLAHYCRTVVSAVSS